MKDRNPFSRRLPEDIIHEHKAAGRCYICGVNPADSGKVSCSSCRESDRIRQQKKKERAQ